jgi:hypothetical protein
VLAVAAVLLAAVVGGLALLNSCPDDHPGAGPAATTSSTGADAGSTDAGSTDVGSTRSGAASAAAAVLQAWSRPGLSYAWWWDGLRPLLSPGARAAYARTDPDQLPTLGELAVVEERDAPTTATVWFHTEAGRFGVDLARSADGEAWLAQRILFPGQQSVFG